ncbi:MAG: hypothetical protein ACFCGT_08915 [Sandaracinaceae bacterium]
MGASPGAGPGGAGRPLAGRRRAGSLGTAAALALVLLGPGCGAPAQDPPAAAGTAGGEAGPEGLGQRAAGEAEDAAAPEVADRPDAAPDAGDGGDGAVAEDAPDVASDAQEAPEPAAPEAVVVEAGARLGPIRIGMTEAEVAALGLEADRVDPRTRAFGPYRVTFREGAVARVEAYLGDLRRIRIGEVELGLEDHIHRIRDAIGTCRWREGGGERYACEDGTLWVHTTHSLAPERYTISVRAAR